MFGGNVATLTKHTAAFDPSLPPQQTAGSPVLQPPPSPQVQATGFSEEDKQAIEWAKQHSNDPRAVRILTMHGVK